MFKFTVRELLLVTAIVGLATGWWLDHSSLAPAKLEAIQDARTIRNLTMPERRMCGSEGIWLEKLREKYDMTDVDAGSN